MVVLMADTKDCTRVSKKVAKKDKLKVDLTVHISVEPMERKMAVMKVDV